MDISIYREEIKKLKPLMDSKFKYNINKWSKLNPDFVSHVNEFENLDISRHDVIYAFREYYSNKIRWEKPFLLTMIWGFADTGYGTFRTNNYITEKDNQNKIRKSFDAVRDNDLELAYKILKSIKGLNISYISKILYFATRACDYSEYALIYDIRVARSLIKLTTLPEIFEIVEINPSSKFSHYKIYNSLMHRYANELDFEAESLEMFLFNLK
ncbi:8-oxoguanine DNA glycosylase OGG fold protein [Flavobacterium tistrianum]|uniref:8-oxoguanine DNA glycosylase OGG fold protein n=1 Tax=Flavobacterium tistrianum TaxID=1685414 RepID=UPI000DAD232E|nr:hypothetical protein [Flavobacterium tistrianum]KAF2342639.1 hypothetical protein DMB71_03020 [Flavobacterium tistrianum]